MQVDNNVFFAAVAEQLAMGQRVRITLKGISMRPTLNEGDTLTVEPVSTVTVGDVVLFRYEGRYCLHRVVGIDGDRCTMQGDNCYTTEVCHRSDVVGRLVEVNGSDDWQRRSGHVLRRKRVRNFAIRWLGRSGRRQLRPWYFVGLAILMWAPLNGMGIPLNNYVFGLRLDHLLHASVFIPCTLFVMDLMDRRWAVWLLAVTVGLLTESIQWLLPYRGFDINDMVANFLGVSLGWVVILAVRRGVRMRRQCPVHAKHGECR